MYVGPAGPTPGTPLSRRSCTYAGRIRCSPGASVRVVLAVRSAVVTASETYASVTCFETLEKFVRMTSVENVLVSTTTGSVRPARSRSELSTSGVTKEPSDVTLSLITAYA